MTNLLYLQNTYLFESESFVKEIVESGEGVTIVLDSTIFYPQGGGQPADTGIITNEAAEFKVTGVRMDETGRVHHFGEFSGKKFKTGDKVQLKIDGEQRKLFARLHSAGHLLDCAVYKLKLEELKPIKGFHFAAGSHVEYQGIKENLKELIPELQNTVDELIQQDLPLEKLDVTPEEAKAQGLFAPPGKAVRVVNFAGYPICGCGGTHVTSSSEIGKITIRKVKTRKGNTKISYSIS